MERDAEQHRHEEAIVPVRPGLRAGASTSAAARSRPGRSGSLLVTGALAALAATAALVFVALPRWVERPAESGAAAPASELELVELNVPVLTEEELAALRERAEELLADLLTQQQRLDRLSAESWGGDDWLRYGELAREGDDAYLADSLQAAVDTYSAALELGDALLARSAEISARALQAGRDALEAGNARLASEQFDLVLGIEPEHEAATAGKARAERLPEVLELVRSGGELAEQGGLEDAATAYRAALEIDSAWAPARRALTDVEQRIEAARFEAAMSRGMQALTSKQYGAAEEAFEAALAINPGSEDARDGLVQAGQGMKLDQIMLAQTLAAAFERRELWSQAIEQYEAALATDGALAFAREGLERARARADLDAKLVNLLENSSLLLQDDVLEDARALLDQAKEVADAAEAEHDARPVRLDEQVTELDALVVLASTPIPVELVSDQRTEVTLYRVGQLGTFEATELELRPGHYTVVGSRDGYRDVRKNFSVLPGRELEPISVICVEPI